MCVLCCVVLCYAEGFLLAIFVFAFGNCRKGNLIAKQIITSNSPIIHFNPLNIYHYKLWLNCQKL